MEKNSYRARYTPRGTANVFGAVFAAIALIGVACTPAAPAAPTSAAAAQPTVAAAAKAKESPSAAAAAATIPAPAASTAPQPTAAPPAAGQPPSGSPVALGAYVPLTGVASFVGQGWKLGSQMAIDEINSHGGLNGRKLQVTFEDDAGSPSGSVTAVKRLVQQEKVFAVLGGSTSTATVSVVPAMASGPTPLYVSLGSDPRILNPFSKYVYSGAGVPSDDVVAAMASFVDTHLHAKSAAIMQCDQAFCQSSVPPLAKALKAANINVTTIQQYTSGDTDFTGQLAQVKNTNPAVLIIFGLATDGGRMIPQIRRMGITATIVGDTSLADPSVLKLAGNDANGFYTFWIGASQSLDDRTGAMGDWRSRFEKAFPNAPAGTPNLYTLMAYSDTYVVAEAIRRCGNDVTQENFLNQLNTIKDFVAGKDTNFTYASPISLPRTFSADNHQGSRVVTPIVAEGGVFRTAK